MKRKVACGAMRRFTSQRRETPYGWSTASLFGSFSALRREFYSKQGRESATAGLSRLSIVSVARPSFEQTCFRGRSPGTSLLMIVLGINAVFHDPAAALVVDGKIVAAAEEERFSRRKHGKPCVPFSTWELPEAAARWCLTEGGVTPAQLDAARVQTVDRREEPLVARMLEHVERLTGVPVVVNTSLNTAGRPMVDDPRDALECFCSAPVDALAIGPFLLRRETFARGSAQPDERDDLVA
jgi:hypothetical protein